MSERLRLVTQGDHMARLAEPCPCHVVLPSPGRGRYKLIPFRPCEDVEDADMFPGEVVTAHIPCAVDGPYCEGPDCLCRQSEGSATE